MFKKLYLSIYLAIWITHLAAQNNDIKRMVGDTTFATSVQFDVNHSPDTTIVSLNDGYYRLAFDENIDFYLKIEKRSGSEIPIYKKLNYLDFQIDSKAQILFIYHKSDTSEKDVSGKLFKVYSKNTIKSAPSFSFKGMDGKTFNNESVRSKITVLNFWFIACSPCVKEIPELNNVVKYFENDEKITFLAVSSDSARELKNFKMRRKFDYELISDKKALLLAEEFTKSGLISAPVHIILDQRGYIVFQYIGGHPNIDQMLINKIKTLL